MIEPITNIIILFLRIMQQIFFGGKHKKDGSENLKIELTCLGLKKYFENSFSGLVCNGMERKLLLVSFHIYSIPTILLSLHIIDMFKFNLCNVSSVIFCPHQRTTSHNSEIFFCVLKT